MGFGVILTDFMRALGQLGDRRFRRVVLLGVLLAIVLLVGVYAGFLGLIQWITPDSLDLPFVGTFEGLHSLLGWASAALMIGLSVFLMVPVAALLSGLYLEDVVRAVEDRHYPELPPVAPGRISDTLIDTANFFAVLVVVNAIALIAYAFVGPFMPVVFWAMNGYLLGREFFGLVATRRLGRPAAKALRSRYSGQIWLAGTLMAAPLSIPFVNLFIPVLGVATFTHMFHRLAKDQF
jgi:CysZ protein